MPKTNNRPANTMAGTVAIYGLGILCAVGSLCMLADIILSNNSTVSNKAKIVDARTDSLLKSFSQRLSWNKEIMGIPKENPGK